jgi:mannose-6-phosphate isomerase-like protein (cupin superfamily)
MKVQLAETLPVPVTHDPQLLKRVLLKDTDTRSNLKMLNHTAMEPGQSFRSHSHPTMEEVFYFLSGEGVFTLGEETTKVSAGDCVYVPIATVHACTNIGLDPLVFLAFGIALKP